jgi:hypothetical protein
LFTLKNLFFAYRQLVEAFDIRRSIFLPFIFLPLYLEFWKANGKKMVGKKMKNILQRMTRRPNVKRVPNGFQNPVYPVHPCSGSQRI